MYQSTIRSCLWGILIAILFGSPAATSSADSTSILGALTTQQQITIPNLRNYHVMSNKLWVQTLGLDPSNTRVTCQPTFSSLDPASLEVLWSVEGMICHPTCNRCAEPCIACETSNFADPDTISIFDVAGSLLHRQTYPPYYLADDHVSPVTTSSPRGQYFFISWCSGYEKFPVYGRDGRLLFDSDRPRGNANEAYAFSDSLIMIPVYMSPDNLKSYERPLLEMLTVPDGRLATSLELPSPHRYGDAEFLVSPSGGRAIAYSHVGQVSMIGPNLTVSWSARLLQHVSRAAFSIDGQYLTSIGRDTATAIDGPLKLVFVSSDSGRVLWSRLLPSGCDNHLPAYEPIYLTGRVIRVGGRDFTLLVHFGSNGEWISEECSHQRIDLIATGTGYITISRSAHDDRTLISNTWQVSR